MPTQVVIAMKCSPEKTLNGSGIINWFNNYGYLNEFLDACAENGVGNITYNNKTYLHEITFIPNKSWPKTLYLQALEANIYLGNPDDDGNYPIDGMCVTSEIRFIDGQAVELMV